ncbi:MAG: hypothetical protein KJ556_13285 [Gammaproteobacteria bacterium]|nr:hypothetical protein [Gammaproteobacteria bacterium]MBU2059657.1 hypothetical protein [Gammaproteobacteria bacterium]MBU2176092.1 hypothetical protein [Gammaproteobacteria bacterium]MBU2245280.1 hypothetical protein [Gammaproteobacteria bacterium]MBU2343866.1 hypothetical protein [Gammaproteobacteria bacterium]
MNTIKLIVAASILASVSFAAEQAPATEPNQNLEFANTCNQWPICRGITFAEQNDAVQLSGAKLVVISKTA